MLINLELDADEAPKMIFTTPADAPAGGVPYEGNGSMGRQGKLLRLAGCIDLDSKVTVGPLAP